ncbi:MAG: CoA-transferase subunit beta [Chloroflexi bacterium]|nr:CoA-transferase subunit beta [Chloroflexota bacterium]
MGQEKTKFNYTVSEQVIVTAAREVKDGDIIYVGVGIQTAAAFLAKLHHAPKATIFFEQGIVRATTCRLPGGTDDCYTQTMSDMLEGVFYGNTLAQRGLVDIGFLAGGEVDRYGNINSTVIGDYFKPDFRFPGGGGACDISNMCRNVTILIRQKKQRFPERVNYITCPGYLDGKPGSREAVGMLPGTGPSKVITDLGIYTFQNGEMVLQSIHAVAGVTVEEIKAETGWELKVADDLGVTLAPTEEELKILRETVQPQRTSAAKGWDKPRSVGDQDM